MAALRAGVSVKSLYSVDSWRAYYIPTIGLLGTLLGAIENLWEDAPPTENAYNLVVCPPKATTLIN